jgi:hypothetical protein
MNRRYENTGNDFRSPDRHLGSYEDERGMGGHDRAHASSREGGHEQVRRQPDYSGRYSTQSGREEGRGSGGQEGGQRDRHQGGSHPSQAYDERYRQYESEGDLSRMGGSQQMMSPTQGGGRYSGSGYGSPQREFGTSYGHSSGYDDGRRGMTTQEHNAGVEGSYVGGGDRYGPRGGGHGEDGYGGERYGQEGYGRQGRAYGPESGSMFGAGSGGGERQGGEWRGNEGYGRNLRDAGGQGYGGRQRETSASYGGSQSGSREDYRGGGAYGSGLPGEYGGQHHERGGWPSAGRSGQQPGFGADDHRGRGPKGYTRSDERLKEDVCERLTDDPHIDASDIHVEVEQGVVRLNGQVSDRWMKYHVEDVVDRCAGIKDIENRLGTQRRNEAGSGSSTRSPSGGAAGNREQNNEFDSSTGGSKRKN